MNTHLSVRTNMCRDPEQPGDDRAKPQDTPRARARDRHRTLRSQERRAAGRGRDACYDALPKDAASCAAQRCAVLAVI